MIEARDLNSRIAMERERNERIDYNLRQSSAT